MERRIFDPRAGLWLLVAANIIAFRPHTLWLELALVGLLLLLMAAHGKFSMAVKWAVGYCALLLFQQYILPASPKIIATSFTIFATYARRMFPCLMTGSLMLKCTPLRYFIVGLRQLRVPQRLIVAVSVTLRYFPAIREEMGYIRDAMKLRDVRGLARLEGTVMPLMVSATETAVEGDPAPRRFFRPVHPGRIFDTHPTRCPKRAGGLHPASRRRPPAAAPCVPGGGREAGQPPPAPVAARTDSGRAWSYPRRWAR